MENLTLSQSIFYIGLLVSLVFLVPSFMLLDSKNKQLAKIGEHCVIFTVVILTVFTMVSLLTSII